MRVASRTLLTQVVFGAACFAAARLSGHLGLVHGLFATASAGAGVGVAGVFLLGWPGLIGLGAGCVGASLTMHVPGAAAALVTVAALIEAASASVLLRRAGFDPALRRISDVIALVLCGAVLPGLLSSLIGVFGVEAVGQLHGVSLLVAWRDWELVTFARTVIVAALLLVLASGGWSGLRSRQTVRVAASAVVLGLLTAWLFDGRGSIPYPLLLVLFVMAAVYRQRGATLGAAALAFTTVVLTTQGEGPFVLGAAHGAMVRGETFVSVGAVAALMIAAAFSERLRLQRALLSLDESRQALAEAQRVGEIGSFELDLRTLETVWSEELYRIVGYESDVETSWPFWRERIVPEDLPMVDEITQELMVACGSGEFVSRFIRLDGQIRWVETKVHFERDEPDGPVLRARGTCRDVTSLKLAEARLRALFEHAPYPIVVVDGHGTIVETNVPAQELLERSADELVGRSIDAFVQPRGPSGEPQERASSQPWYTEVGADGTHPHVELWSRRADGAEFPLEVFLTPLPTEHGTLMSIGLRDVTEVRRAAELLRFQARHDILTGLPNRMMFLEHLDMALARARRSGRPLAVVFADLDDFKDINDGYGHEVGDRLLQALTPRMHAAVRHGDLVARLGGDEFVILCEDLEGESAARWVAQRFADGVSQPLVVAGREHQVTLSAGVAIVNDAREAEAVGVLRDADAAMYSAKARGKGRIAIFDPATRVEVWGRAAAS